MNNFNRWFGNSKIKDDNGNPLVCYHGTDSDFLEFDFTKIGYNSGNFGHYGYGVYFSTEKNEARIYGKNIIECYLKVENPFMATEKQIMELKEKQAGIIDDLEHLSIDYADLKKQVKKYKPFIYDFMINIEKYGLTKAFELANKENHETLNDFQDILEYVDKNNSHGIPYYVFDELKKLGLNPKLNKGFRYHQSLHYITDLGNLSKEVTETIKELGYDGVWYGSEIVIFSPYQIKSVHNKGTFNPKNKNIFEDIKTFSEFSNI